MPDLSKLWQANPCLWCVCAMPAQGKPAMPTATPADTARILASPFSMRQRNDVFDADDFDATKFINQLYPDGALPCGRLLGCYRCL